MKVILITLLLLINGTLISQNEYENSIVEQSKIMSDAIFNGEYEVLADYTYPLIIEMMGGKDSMMRIIENAMDNMKNQGFSFSNIDIGKPSRVYEAGDELHCIMSQTIELKNSEGTLKSKSYLLGISKNDGKNWFFIDTGQLTNETVYEMFPDFNSDLIIPETEQPEFISN